MRLLLAISVLATFMVGEAVACLQAQCLECATACVSTEYVSCIGF